jgi:hypothetical protein
MALPQIIQRIIDLEAGYRECVSREESLEEYRDLQLIREAEMLDEFITSLDRTFALEMGLADGIGNIVTEFFNGTSHTGYIGSDGDSLVTPVTIVYNGNSAPNGSALVLRMETITV